MAAKKSTYAGRQSYGAIKAGFVVYRDKGGWCVAGPGGVIDFAGPFGSKKQAESMRRRMFLDRKGLFPF